MGNSDQENNRLLSAKEIEECERRLGYIFGDKSLLEAALTHASGADHRLASNERLEFLGDAILGMLVCEILYRKFPKLLEGDMTKIKSVVVSRQTCAKISSALGIADFLILGKGMANSPTVPNSLLSNMLESVLAAMYLDGGMPPARRFVKRHLAEEIERVSQNAAGANFKSLLQQLAQRKFTTTPTYQLLDEKGPDHSKCFKIRAEIANGPASKYFAPAWGRNKKEAEQRAAQNALAELRGEEPPFPSD